MTRKEFILALCRAFEADNNDIFIRGQKNGWLEYEDELYSDDSVTRKNIARIIHMYLLKELYIPDLYDIQKAEVLRDLYDCRTCANHVAQVYLRGIMDARDLAASGGFIWFDLDGIDESSVIDEYLRRAVSVVGSL